MFYFCGGRGHWHHRVCVCNQSFLWQVGGCINQPPPPPLSWWDAVFLSVDVKTYCECPAAETMIHSWAAPPALWDTQETCKATSDPQALSQVDWENIHSPTRFIMNSPEIQMWHDTQLQQRVCVWVELILYFMQKNHLFACFCVTIILWPSVYTSSGAFWEIRPGTVFLRITGDRVEGIWNNPSYFLFNSKMLQLLCGLPDPVDDNRFQWHWTWQLHCKDKTR